MFDELLTWWPSQVIELPNSRQIEEEVHERMEENNEPDNALTIEEVSAEGEPIVGREDVGARLLSKSKSSWQIDVCPRMT